MKKVCYIVGAGDFITDCMPQNGDFVIAADGGYAYLEQSNITPDMAVGDFDSLKRVPSHANMAVYPCEKDDTDMGIAIKYALENGYDSIIINGGCGGRIDHTLANIQMLAYIAKHGARGYLLGKGYCMTAFEDGFLNFGQRVSGYVSVFCMGQGARGVYERGFKYSLTDASLNSYFPLGVSNEMTDDTAYISVEKGCLTVVFSGDVRKMIADN